MLGVVIALAERDPRKWPRVALTPLGQRRGLAIARRRSHQHERGVLVIEQLAHQAWTASEARVQRRTFTACIAYSDGVQRSRRTAPVPRSLSAPATRRALGDARRRRRLEGWVDGRVDGCALHGEFVLR